ncbi:MAG: rod shape-determining protein RodA [Acidimicrobiales bacterium]
MAVVTRSRADRLNPRRDPLAPWLHVDFMLVLGTVALASFGAAVIYSATRGADPAAYDATFLERQVMFIMVGGALMAGVALVPYNHLRAWAALAYAGGLVGLAGVLVLGISVNGARSWFEIAGFQIQPSEFLKVAYIAVLAAYVSRFEGEMNLRQLGATLAIAAPPLLLIMAQPDVGTALVFVAITMGVLLIGGARFRHILLMTALGLFAAVVIWNSGTLASYQQERLISFIDPASSQTDTAYQQTQAQIAIGSGGITGQGFGNGRQTRGEFVPAQHTDFIFTVVAEEFGFVGSALVLSLFGLIVWRTWRTAKKAADMYGSLICVGVMTMVVFQMFQAIGMTMGIMPITGIPVPFLSYGGSSALTSFIAVGLVLNVHMRRYEVR